MKITLTELELALRAPLVTAHGTLSVRRIIQVTAEQFGRKVHGEAAPLPGFGLETYEEALTQLERWAELVGAADDSGTHVELPATPAARAAAAGALANLDAALEAITLTELLTGKSNGRDSQGFVSEGSDGSADSAVGLQRLAVQALISAIDPAAAAQQAADAARAGYLAVKLKVGAPASTDIASTDRVSTGTASPDIASTDIARIVEVRRALPAAVALRLDANGGWDRSTAGRVLRAVSSLDIDFVETPTQQPADWAQLSQRTGARIAADEHLSGPDASEVLDQLIAAGAIEVAVLKPATVGGSQVAYDLACRASVSGVSSIVSSFMCATDGLRIARDVALAVAPNLVHGVGTGAMFAEPLADDVTPQSGYLCWTNKAA